MNSRPLIPVLVVIVVVGGLAVTGYFMNKNGDLPTASSAASTTQTASTTASAVATSTPPPATPVAAASSTDPILSDLQFPATTTTADASSWQAYTDAAHGFTLSYPSDLVRSSDPSGNLVLSFPQNVYFHWPLLDHAQVTISAAASCPSITTGLGQSAQDYPFSVNGISWNGYESTDVGAGQRYVEVAYDAVSGTTCVHIDFLDKGTNGAGFYVDDQSLIQKYDAAHDADLSAVAQDLNGIVGSLRFSH